MADEPRVAVLIDADNVSPRLAPALIAETATHGVLGIKRIYGDWNRTRSPPRFPRTWQSTYGGEPPQGPRRRLGPARECRLMPGLQ